MLFQKLRKITAVICIIFLSQINVTGVSTSSSSVAQDDHVSYSVGFNSAEASGLKDIDNSFLKDKFIPHVVLLGLGLMSFFLIKHSESYSADTILFIAGTSLYFVNIIMSWKSEVKDFEFDKADVENNTQKSALVRQREGLEDYLDIAQKRYKFLQAATAAVALAAVSAGALFLSGRKAMAKLKVANKKQQGVLKTPCVDVQPQLAAACNASAVVSINQLNVTEKNISKLDETIVKTTRNPKGSFAGAKDYFFAHTPMTAGYKTMGYIDDEMLEKIRQSNANKYLTGPRGMIPNPDFEPYDVPLVKLTFTSTGAFAPDINLEQTLKEVADAEMGRRFKGDKAKEIIKSDIPKMEGSFRKTFQDTRTSTYDSDPPDNTTAVAFSNEIASPYSDYNDFNDKALFISEPDAEEKSEEVSYDMLENLALAGLVLQTTSSTQPNLLNELSKMFIPSAHANAVSAIIKPIAKVANIAFREFDRWLFTPKGRMVVYGSVTALLGFYTVYTKKGISDIKDNIDSLDDMIDKFDENEASSASFTPKEATPAVVAQKEFSFEALFGEMFSKIIPKAYASEAPILTGGELPIRLPCMVLDKGRCLDAQKAYDNKMPLSARTSIPQDVQKMGSRALALTNQIQMNNKVDDKAMSLIDSLASQSDKLVAFQRKYESGVNKALQSQGERPIPFEDYRKSFLNGLGKDIDQMARRMGTSTEQIAMTKFSKGPQSSFLKTKLGSKEDSGANLMDFLAEEKSSAGFEETEFDFSEDSSETSSVSATSSPQEEPVNLNNGDYDEAMFSYSDIHKNKSLDIFNIISRRYELLRPRLKE